MIPKGRISPGDASGILTSEPDSTSRLNVGAGSSPISRVDEIREAGLKTCIDGLTLAERIGAECCVNVSGSMGEPWFGHDPENLTDTGVDITARPPGKRLQSLNMLSGGERALTAAALIFSLLKVSPTPFCVLDEVDAMLDEANVGRFRQELEKLAEEIQFIIITHNRRTIEAANTIYGVSMGDDSVSRVISLKLDEVEQR